MIIRIISESTGVSHLSSDMAQQTNAVKCFQFLEFQTLVTIYLVGLIGLTQYVTNT
jgi:hypothetical protein